jgi:3-oxoacyl-[acyl-carrier-protein] synthase-3
MTSHGIIGTGFYVPEEIRDNGWWPKSFVERFEERAKKDPTTPEVLLSRAQTREQRVQFEEMLKTYHDPFRGSRHRRVAPPGWKTSDLEIPASKMALEHARIRPADLDYIIEYACPPDIPCPNNATLLQEKLGAKKAFAFEVDSACCSFLAGLRVADALLKQSGRYALVVAGSLFTRTQDWDDPASIGVGDGAGAAVIGPAGDGLGFLAHVNASRGDLYNGVCYAPKTDDAWWDGKAPLYAHSKNVEAGHAIVANSGKWALEARQSATELADIEPAEITNFYAHQPASWFNATCRRAMGIDLVKTIDTFEHYASIGSANIPANLVHAQKAGQLSRGDVALLYACGMGLSIAATLVRWSLDT